MSKTAGLIFAKWIFFGNIVELGTIRLCFFCGPPWNCLSLSAMLPPIVSLTTPVVDVLLEVLIVELFKLFKTLKALISLVKLFFNVHSLVSSLISYK